MAVVEGLLQGLGQIGIPVAIAPVDRQPQSPTISLGLQRRLQLAVLLVDGAHPAEMAVVVRDLLEALVGDAAPARDVAQEGDDVALPLGAAEAGEDDGVVGDGRGHMTGLGLRERRVARRERQLVVGDGHERTSKTWASSSASSRRRPV